MYTYFHAYAVILHETKLPLRLLRADRAPLVGDVNGATKATCSCADAGDRGAPMLRPLLLVVGRVDAGGTRLSNPLRAVLAACALLRRVAGGESSSETYTPHASSSSSSTTLLLSDDGR